MGPVTNPEGWFIDDVELRGTTRILGLTSPAVTAFRTPNSVSFIAATGPADWNNDGLPARDGFLISSGVSMFPTDVFLFDGQDTFPALVDITASTPASPGPADRVVQIAAANDGAPEFFVAGDLDGNGFGDIVGRYQGATFAPPMQLPEESIVIYSGVAGNPADSAVTVSGSLYPLGDIDGGGVADLSVLTQETSDRLAEDGSQLIHDVFHVHIDPAVNQMRTAITTLVDPMNAPDPRAVIEPGRSFFRSSGTATRTSSVVSLGNINGDARSDFGVVDPLGSGTHVFLGQPFATATPASVNDLPIHWLNLV